MADKKISALTAATTPLDGTEVLPIVQSSTTVKVANSDLRPKQIQSNATSGVLQITGPAAGSTRVMTTPNANFTAARTDAAQTFTGLQTFSGSVAGDWITKSVNSSATGYGAFIQVEANDTTYKLIGGFSNTAVAYTFNVYSNGNVTNTNGSYGAISDAKLKDVIGPAPSYWDKFKQYQFVNYTLKSDETKTKLLGLIAQQAEQVCPSIVFESPDLDAQGNDLGTSTKSVKYSIVSMQAEVVLQEAMARIEQLEAQVQALLANKG